MLIPPIIPSLPSELANRRRVRRHYKHPIIPSLSRNPGEPPQGVQVITHITLTQRIYSGANTINGQSPHTTEIQAVLGAATP